MVKNKTQLKKIIKRYINAVNEVYKLDRVYLFGSYAKNKQRKWSDIDLAMVSKDFETIDSYTAMVMLARLKRDIEPAIEALPFIPEDIDNPQLGSIEYAVAKEGKLIWRK
ncbi:MAG: nucleotidyltransferase domain-containing protein [Pseudomonadota bacterium]